jgi:hypothetical protein
MNLQPASGGPPSNPRPARQASAPPAVAQWVGSTSLLQMVRSVVEGAEWPGKPGWFAFAGQSFPSVQLMTLEVYCYARGVYLSDEIQELAQQDTVFRDLFPESWPQPQLIKRFRREHAGPIRECLRRIFTMTLAARFGEGDTEGPVLDACVAAVLDGWFEPLCGPRPVDEAAARVERAKFLDGMSSS